MVRCARIPIGFLVAISLDLACPQIVLGADAPAVYLATFGSCGSGPGQMQSLWGIAVGPDGSVWVADEFNQRVTRFDNDGNYLGQFAVANAFDVAVAADGTVYVLRRGAARVDRYSSGGALLGGFGAPGAGDGQFSDPFGIAIAPNGEVFVADSGNDRIQRFSADGAFLGKWGRAGGQLGEFGFASELAVDGAGNVFVIDPQLGRLTRFSTTGVVLGWWFLGGPNHVPMTLNYGLAADGTGHVYVVEQDRLVDEYTIGGAFLVRFGGYGSGKGQFQFALTIAADATGNVFVSDRTPCRIQKFGPEPPVPAFAASWGRVKASYR